MNYLDIFKKEIENLNLNEENNDNNENNKNKCLISGESLNEDSVTLLCNHSFNYESIFNEVIRQKKNVHNYELIILNKNQIKCPYCNSIQNKLLPNLLNNKFEDVEDVNYPLNKCMYRFKCNHIMKSGKNKGNLCGKNSNEKYCKIHMKYYINN